MFSPVFGLFLVYSGVKMHFLQSKHTGTGPKIRGFMAEKPTKRWKKQPEKPVLAAKRGETHPKKSRFSAVLGGFTKNTPAFSFRRINFSLRLFAVGKKMRPEKPSAREIFLNYKP